MTKMRVLALLAVTLMMLMVPAVASAQQVPPHVFIGTVTVNGLSAPAGTTISAVIDGVQQGSASTGAGGSYILHVNQGSGTDISFMVDTLTAEETGSWVQGGADALDLTAGFVGDVGKGDKGDKGDTGAGGAKGDTGAAGARGQVGPAGPAGPAGGGSKDGADGADGAAGPAGAKGDAGATGAAGGSGGVALIGLILSIVALLGVAGVFFASRQSS